MKHPHVPLSDRTAQQVHLAREEARAEGREISQREVLRLAVELGLPKVLPYLRAAQEQADRDGAAG